MLLLGLASILAAQVRCNSVWRKASLESSSGSTLMDDSFARLLNLASYLEAVLFGDVESISEDPDASHSGWHEGPSHIYDHSTCVDSLISFSDATTYISVCDRRPLRQKENHYLIRSSGNVGSSNTRYLIYLGLMYPLFGLKLCCRFASSCLRCFCMYIERTYTRFCGFISCVQRTMHGSFSDIGWLQRTKGLPPVVDGTSRFMEILNDIRNGEHCLPNTLVYLLIPGLFSNHSPLYFVNTKRFFSKMGLTSHIAKIHSEASVEKNALELKQYIEELFWGSGKRVLLLGHSKGGVDAAAALSMYWSDLKDKVAGIAMVQSPYGGSPIASDILREGQVADKEARRIMQFIICEVIKGDMRALEDLTYDKRREFITKQRFPSEQLPVISFHTEASVSPGVLATMSLIAHTELPRLPLPNFFKRADEVDSGINGQKVPVVVPLAAAMAISALHLKLRYGESSDGLVTRRDAEVPGSVVVRPERKLDHAWMVYSLRNQIEADASEMCESLLTMLVEIGKMKKDVASTA